MDGALTVGRLPDGRFQGWMYDSSSNKLYTFVQANADPQSNWSALTEFPMPAPISGNAYGTPFSVYPDAQDGLAVSSLPDGRLQLWLAGSYGIWTCAMLTSNASSQWSLWRQICDPPVPVPWVQSLRLTQQYQRAQVQAGAVAAQAPRP